MVVSSIVMDKEELRTLSAANNLWSFIGIFTELVESELTNSMATEET